MVYNRSKIADVHAIVARRGGWSSVYAYYPALNDAIKKREKGSGSGVPCPVNNTGKTVFRLYKDWNESGGGYHNDKGRIGDGIDMVAWLENTSKSNAMDIILELLNETRENVSQREVKAFVEHRQQVQQLSEEDLAKRLWILQKVENEAIHASQSEIAMNYLYSRGLGNIDIPCNVGFHPKMKAYGRDNQEYWLPCLLFYIQNISGNSIAFHRIFLNETGSNKSTVMENPKMQMKGLEDAKNGSIQLGLPLLCIDAQGNHRVVLAVGEGPETCLAIQHVEGVPVWSGISSTLMEGMAIPQEVTDLLIFQDKDRLHENQERPEGERAALALKAKVNNENPHCNVQIFCPPNAIVDTAKSQDWLDEWVDFGSASFPNYLQANGLTVVDVLVRDCA